MPNSGEYKSRVGLDSLYVAEVTQDDIDAYVAGTPAYFAPAAEASQEPTTSFEIQYADDQPFDVMTSEGDTKINLVVTGLDLETLALITGRVFDTVSGRVFDNGGTAPYMALSFRSLKSNGSYRYYQYLKGKFDMPKEETVTRGEKPEPKTLALTYTAIRTTFKFDLGSIDDSVKRIIGDTDTTNFSETGWFSQVQTPESVAPSALSLSSSVPTDGATGVVGTSNMTLTFNNALPAGAIYGISLINVSDFSVVAGVISLDATKKIVTINPTPTLTAGAEYLIVYNVTDIYAQNTAGVVNFTVAP